MTGTLIGWPLPAERKAVGFTSPHSQALLAIGGPLEDQDESHMLVIAPTGAGKGRSVMIPNLLHYPGPAIVIDIKGEAAAVTSRYRRQRLGQEVVILDPWHVVTDDPATFNPLDCLRQAGPSLVDNAYTLASMLSDGNRSREPYWDERAESAIAGAMVYAVTYQLEQDRSLGRVWQLMNQADTIYQLALLLELSPGLDPFAYAQLNALISMSADITRSCILSVVQQHLRVFATGPVQQAVAKTSFDLGRVKSGGPMTIYIVVPPSKLRSHASLLRVWLSSLLGLVAERKRRPKQPTLLLIDELAQLGAMEQITQAVTLLRGYGLRCALFAQSFGQLKSLYPEDHETIAENCGTILSFGHTSMSMSQQIASLFGDITPEALFSLPAGHLAVHRAGRQTEIAGRLDYLQDAYFRGRFDANPLFAANNRSANQASTGGIHSQHAL